MTSIQLLHVSAWWCHSGAETYRSFILVMNCILMIFVFIVFCWVCLFVGAVNVQVCLLVQWMCRIVCWCSECAGLFVGAVNVQVCLLVQWMCRFVCWCSECAGLFVGAVNVQVCHRALRLPVQNRKLRLCCDPRISSRQCFRSGPGSSVGIVTVYGLDGLGIESRWGEIFRTCTDRPWGPPRPLYQGYRVFPEVNSGRGVTLTLHPLLVPLVIKE